MRAPLFGTALLFSTIASQCAVALAAPALPQPWVTNGQIYAVACDGDRLYVGGDFTMVGPATGCAVVVDADEGRALTESPRLIGTISTAISDDAGGWYIAGSFHAGRGAGHSRIAHLDADGRLSAWVPELDGPVNVLALRGRILYVGGAFTRIDGQARYNFAAIELSTRRVAKWSADADGEVKAIAPGPRGLYIGGYFGHFGGMPRSGLAAIDPRTGTVLDWDARAKGSVVRALALQGTTLYVGGYQLTFADGEPRALVALDARTGAVTPWRPVVAKYVDAVAVHGRTVYVGGGVTYADGAGRSGLAAFDALTGAATTWGSDLAAIPTALTISGRTIFVAGSVEWRDGTVRTGAAELDAITDRPTAWDPHPDGGVNAAEPSGDRVLLGGSFGSVGAIARRNLAAFGLATGVATDWNPTPDGRVFALATQPGMLYVGGDFLHVTSTDRHYLAAFETHGGSLTGWDPQADCFDHRCIIWGLTPAGDLLYAGGTIGYFMSNGGVARNGLAAIDETTGIPTAWAPAADRDWIGSLSVLGEVVYVTGYFTHIGGADRRNVAALDARTGNATDWDPASASTMTALDPWAVVAGDSAVFLGGRSRIDPDHPGGFVVAVDPVTGASHRWGARGDAPVRALTRAGNEVLAGGEFAHLGGEVRHGIAALDATSGILTPWAPDFEGAVATMVASGSTLFAGGEFIGLDGEPRGHVAALPLPTVQTIVRSLANALAPAPAGVSPTDAPLDLRVRVLGGGELRIDFALPIAGEVNVSVFDLAGRRIAELARGFLLAGHHLLSWNTAGLRSGLYFCRLQTDAGRVARAVTLVR